METYYQKWTKHMTVLRGLSPKTVNSYISKIKDFYTWKKKHCGSNILNFTREDVEAYLEYCYYQGNCNFTRNTKLTALRKWNQFLKYEKCLTEDVTNEIPHSNVVRRFPQIFTKIEILKIFSVIDIRTGKGLRDVVIFITAAFMGLRIGEIVNLNIGDVIEAEESPQGGLHFQIVNSKFKSSRLVKLWKVPSMFVRELLALRISQNARISDPLIVTYTKHGRFTGNRISQATLGLTLKIYARKAGIRKTVFMHMFRASHATALRSISNYDLPAIASRLGHRSISTTAERYFATWERVKATYPSLAVYWKEFGKSLWEKQP